MLEQGKTSCLQPGWDLPKDIGSYYNENYQCNVL